MKRLYMVCNIKSTFNNLRDFRVQMAASVAFILIVLIYKRCRFKYDDNRNLLRLITQKIKKNEGFCLLWLSTHLLTSVTRLGDLLDFWGTF